MDTYVYSETILQKFMKKNLFFDDPILEKYYQRDDVRSFRSRVLRVHKKESLEKMLYAFVTDLSRDIILKMVSEITKYMQPMGDVIISGGEAYNYYVEKGDRIVTSDIDTKFAPRIPYDTKYFGKLQGMKLILWDKLGEICTKVQEIVRTRLTTNMKLARFIGFKPSNKVPLVTRRYTLIKKKKESQGPNISQSDVLIDVELFALDLNIRSFSIESGKIEERVLGGFLDIPFMRPGEFGYEVIDTRRSGLTYMNRHSNKLVTDKNIYVAGKKFLVDDIYLMQKLGLRPEKKIKDKQRLLGLTKMLTGTSNSSNNFEKLFRKAQAPQYTPKRIVKLDGQVNMTSVSKINAKKYEKYTSKPSIDALSKRLLYGVKTSSNDLNVSGFARTNGNMRFNINTMKWVENKNSSYIGNQYSLRPINTRTVSNNVLENPPLYGYKPTRDKWISKSILKQSALIPVVGLKK